MSDSFALQFMLVAPEPAHEVERRLAELCTSAWALQQKADNRFQVMLDSHEDLRTLLDSFRTEARAKAA